MTIPNTAIKPIVLVMLLSCINAPASTAAPYNLQEAQKKIVRINNEDVEFSLSKYDPPYIHPNPCTEPDVDLETPEGVDCAAESAFGRDAERYLSLCDEDLRQSLLKMPSAELDQWDLSKPVSNRHEEKFVYKIEFESIGERYAIIMRKVDFDGKPNYQNPKYFVRREGRWLIESWEHHHPLSWLMIDKDYEGFLKEIEKNRPPSLPEIDAKADISGATVRIGRMSEVRKSPDNGNSFLSVDFELTGNALAASLGISRGEITKAVDDANRNIRVQESNRIFFKPNLTQSGNLTREIGFEDVKRSARTISLSGFIHVSFPTEANGGMVRIPDFRNRPGELLAEAAFKKSGVAFMFVTKDEEDRRAKRIKESAEWKAQNRDDGEVYLSDAFPEFFDGQSTFSGRLDDPDESGALHFLFRDPQNAILDVQFLDPEGNLLDRHGLFISGDVLTEYTFDKLPEGPLQMVVYLDVPGADKKVPFEFKDVPLP